MLKAVRVTCYQNMACYRKPAAIAVQESYPLPPYSSVIGMIHKACDFKEYHPMRVSIQGETAGSVSDLYTRYYFGISYDPGRHQFYTEREDGKRDGITRSLGYAECVTDAKMIFHIIPQNEEDLAAIAKGLSSPAQFPALGRHEDLLRIDGVEIVELYESDGEEELKIFGSAYVPVDLLKEIIPSNLAGTVHTLNKRFEVTEDGKYRRWTERVRAKLVKSGPLVGKILVDKSDSKFPLPVFPDMNASLE